MLSYYFLLMLTIIKLIRLNNAGGNTISSTSWSELSDSLDGYVVLPTDDSYDTAYLSWTATYDDVKPEAVVFCQSENDVVTVMNFILDNTADDGSVMTFAVRSGKHNLAGWSCTDGVVIDVSGLDQLYLSTNNTAIVGPGVSLSVFTKFAEENDFTLPHGDCASVCFGGFLHGGGFGLISRTFGMGIDWINSVHIVLSTGELVTASDGNYNDLFWAIRGGGGGNFGIVTQFEMNIPEKKQTNPGLYLEISWDYSVSLWNTISTTWNSFVEDTSYGNHFAVYLRITPTTYITKDYYIQLHGFWTGEQVDGLMAVAKLLDTISVTPTEAKIDYVAFEGWIESSSSDRLRYSSHCSSRFAFDTLSSDFFTAISTTLQEMIDYDNYADSTDQDELTYGVPTEFLFIAPAGGAISERESSSTAFPWRKATYLFVVCGRYMNDYENAYNFVEEWIVSTMSTMEEYLSEKSFINFPDNNLANWQSAFYGDNYAKLQTLKAKYDPNNVFNFKFAIEQPGTETTTTKRNDIAPPSKSKQTQKTSQTSDKKAIKTYENAKNVDNSKQTSSKTHVANGKNATFSLWLYGVALFMFFSIALIFKTTKCFESKDTNSEYTPVRNRYTEYNTI